MNSDAKASSGPSEVLGIAIFFLCSAPSLFLTNIIIAMFGRESFVVLYVEVILAAITVPLGLGYLLYFFVSQRLKMRSRALRWNAIFGTVGIFLLAGNVLCTLLLWTTYVVMKNASWN
jgi:hypothetical protein